MKQTHCCTFIEIFVYIFSVTKILVITFTEKYGESCERANEYYYPKNISELFFTLEDD